jgi:hypothetical protein
LTASTATGINVARALLPAPHSLDLLPAENTKAATQLPSAR